MKRLYVHVGAHKTGSTTLQLALEKLQDELPNLGYRYAPEGYRLAMAIGTPDDMPDHELTAVRQGLESWLAEFPEQNVILSGEDLFGNPASHYANTGGVAARLRRLTEGLAEVVVIAYVRKQDAFVESLYQQRIKQGATFKFDEYIAGVPPGRFDWNVLLGHYEEVFDDVRVMPYEILNSNERHNFLDEFFRRADLDISLGVANADLPRVNTSYSAVGLEMLRRCNPLLDGPQGLALREFIEQHHHRNAGPRPELFTEESRREFMDGYREANAKLFAARLAPWADLAPRYGVVST